MQEPGTTAWGDARDETHDMRRVIGFDALRERWPSTTPVFENGTLRICGHPVMESWEDGYMKMLADIAGAAGGRVLEVGFGLGMSAQHLQTHPLSEHVIIEANEGVCTHAHQFAQSAPRPARILQGFWEDVVPTLATGSFDAILFDTYPLTEADVHRNHFPFFRHARRLLAPDGVLTYYSDEIDRFSSAHAALLREAGFTRIDGQVCRLTPPSDCRYWKAPSMLAPIIRP